MNPLQARLTEYIAARRALGTRLEEPAQTLRRFVQFLTRRKARFITIPLALEWSQQSQGVQRATWARRLSMVRQFARWLSVSERRHEVPPPRLLDVRHRRGKPHIYSDAEICHLMKEAGRLKSRSRMNALTLQTLIGLLAATGLRPGEAVDLETGDVDLQARVLTVRRSKFDKSRQVPIHSSTLLALKHYASERDRAFRVPTSPYFFVSAKGSALELGTARRWFCKVSRVCGVRKGPADQRYGRGPRLQDLRHTFATRRLVEWYKAGCDVGIQMPKLSTYLGHSSVQCTYWYIEAVPELLELAANLERTSGQGGRS